MAESEIDKKYAASIRIEEKLSRLEKLDDLALRRAFSYTLGILIASEGHGMESLERLIDKDIVIMCKSKDMTAEKCMEEFET